MVVSLIVLYLLAVAPHGAMGPPPSKGPPWLVAGMDFPFGSVDSVVLAVLVMCLFEPVMLLVVGLHFVDLFLQYLLPLSFGYFVHPPSVFLARLHFVFYSLGIVVDMTKWCIRFISLST